MSYIGGLDSDVIELLDLEVRTYNALKRNGIDSVSELAALTEEKLMDLNSFGERCLRDVIVALEELNITLRER